MAGVQKTFAFRAIQNKTFSAFDAKSTQELLSKWGLKDRMRIQIFSYDKYFQDYDKEHFVRDFFDDQAVKDTLQVASTTNTWRPIGDLQPTKADIEIIKCSVTNMEFFDRIYQEGLVRQSGSICKCYDEQIEDFLISDELRKMVLSDESDFFDLFTENERQEFIFQIFKHLCVGGPVCQYEDEVGPYLDTAKFLYKDLVSVHKDTNTKELVVSCIVLKVNLWVDDVMMYPSDQPHEQSFAYFVINPIKRHVIVWYHSWRG